MRKSSTRWRSCPATLRLRSEPALSLSKGQALAGLEAALQAWNQVYERIRPHQALGYLTPEQSYQKWLHNQHKREVLRQSVWIRLRNLSRKVLWFR